MSLEDRKMDEYQTLRGTYTGSEGKKNYKNGL